MNLLLIGISFFFAPSIQAAEQTVGEQVACLNELAAARPNMAQRGYLRHSAEAHYLFYSGGPQINGSAANPGFFRITGTLIEFCEADVPKGRSFNLAEPGSVVVPYEVTSERFQTADPTPMSQARTISAKSCSSTPEVQGAGKFYLEKQVQEMAKRAGRTATERGEREARRALKAPNCEKFVTFPGYFNDGFRERASASGNGATDGANDVPR